MGVLRDRRRQKVPSSLNLLRNFASDDNRPEVLDQITALSVNDVLDDH